ncbi:hypothetical protein Tco_1496594, partial [Tanacetum coccineum]
MRAKRNDQNAVRAKRNDQNAMRAKRNDQNAVRAKRNDQNIMKSKRNGQNAMRAKRNEEHPFKILKKFDFVSFKTASTPIETQKPLVKDEEASDVDVHLYRPSPTPTHHIPDSIPEVSSGNHKGQSSSDKSFSGNEGDMTLQSVYDLYIYLCIQVTDQAKEIKHLKAQIKKQAKPVIKHYRAWMKSGRKSAKGEPSVHKDPLFDELDDDEIDNIDTEDAQDVRNGVNAEKEGTEDAVSTEDIVSTDKEKVSTDRSKVSTDRSKDSTDKEEEGTVKDKDSTVSLDEGIDDRTEARSATPITSTTTPTMFGDDET